MSNHEAPPTLANRVPTLSEKKLDQLERAWLKPILLPIVAFSPVILLPAAALLMLSVLALNWLGLHWFPDRLMLSWLGSIGLIVLLFSLDYFISSERSPYSLPRVGLFALLHSLFIWIHEVSQGTESFLGWGLGQCFFGVVSYLLLYVAYGKVSRRHSEHIAHLMRDITTSLAQVANVATEEARVKYEQQREALNNIEEVAKDTLQFNLLIPVPLRGKRERAQDLVQLIGTVAPDAKVPQWERFFLRFGSLSWFVAALAVVLILVCTFPREFLGLSAGSVTPRSTGPLLPSTRMP